MTREPLPPIVRWYVLAFCQWTEHHGAEPTLMELACWLHRSTSSCYSALRRAAAAGWLERDARGRFRIPIASEPAA